MRCADRFEGVEIGGMPQRIDSDDGADFRILGKRFGHQRRVDCPVAFSDIDKRGERSGMRHRVRRSGKGPVGHDHPVAGPDPRRH